MSGLPIASTMPSSMTYSRETPAAVTAPGSGGVSAAIGTITQQAVQQTRQTEMGGIDTRRILASMQNNRARLVGPPPAFELNVLQHLRETRGKPEEARSADIEATPVSPDEEMSSAEPKAVAPAGYDSVALDRQAGYQVQIDKHL